MEERPNQGHGGYYYRYESSRVFSSMKRVEETIQKNWSTEQYLNALDQLISHMVEPILRSSDFYNHMVAGILAWHSDVANNKITAHDRVAAVEYMMAFLTRQDPDEKLLVFNRIKFDRNVTMRVVDLWLELMEPYRRLCEKSLRDPQLRIQMIELEKTVMHGPTHTSLYAAIASVKYWRAQVVKLRTQIVEKYYRLILSEAKSFYELVQHSISLDDTIQSMYLEASRALDKCNQERGTITSYLQRWLRFSRSNLGTEKDTAFSVSGAARNGDYSYKSVNIDDVTESQAASHDPLEIEDDVSHVRKLARILDPLGVGRHSLGIEEYTPALNSAL